MSAPDAAAGDRGTPAPRPSSCELTSFLALPRQRVVQALRRLLELSEAFSFEIVDVRSDADRVGGLAIALSTPEGHVLRFELATEGAVPRPWAKGGGVVALRLPSDGAGAFLPADLARLARHVAACVRRLDAPDRRQLADDLRRGLDDVQRYRGLTDAAYRQISARSDGTPLGFLRLGFRCNQRCTMCWQQHTWPDAPDELPLVWLDEMAAAGVHDVSLTGGEPTLYPRLLELVERAARRHGMTVSLQTNAIRLARGDLAARLRDAGLTDVLVSFHGATAEVSEAVTGAVGSHAATVAGIQSALASGLAVSLNAIVERRTLAHLPAHAHEVLRLFVTSSPANPVRTVDYSHPCRYADAAEWARAVVPFDEVRPLLREARRILVDGGVGVSLLGSCGWPDCVVPDGPVPARRPRRDDLDLQDVAGRVFLAPCDACAARGTCLGVRREYVDVHGARGLTPLPKTGA